MMLREAQYMLDRYARRRRYDNNAVVTLALVSGVTAGVLVGLLLTPASDKGLRERLKQKAALGKQKLEDAKEAAKNTAETVANTAEHAALESKRAVRESKARSTPPEDTTNPEE